MSDDLPPASTWPNTPTVRSAFVHVEEGTSWAGSAFDAWLEAERQAARNETAKAIRDEIERVQAVVPGSFSASILMEAADISAAHIEDQP